MPRNVTLAISQSHTLSSLGLTLCALSRTAQRAAQRHVHLLLFPEAYLGGYPRGCGFGTAIGERTESGRDQYLAYTQSAVDLGDTSRGAGGAWINRTLPVAKERGQTYRGDGTREYVEEVARETGVFLVVGVIEKAGGSLYCSAIYVDPERGSIGKRRKVMPTATERLVWAQGQPDTLRAATAMLGGVKVTLAAAICWENYMPLLRAALYSQGVNLWCAPTADGRDVWQSLIRTIGAEGRCFVMSANQCIRRRNLPEWVKTPTEEAVSSEMGQEELDEEVSGDRPSPRTRRKSVITKTEDNHEITWPQIESKDEMSNPETGLQNGRPQANGPKNPVQFHKLPTNGTLEASQMAGKPGGDVDGHVVALPSQNAKVTSNAAQANREDEIMSHGGSCIISPSGDILAGPIWDKEDELLVTTVDFEDCDRGHLDLDVVGHYGRLDSFALSVQGLDLDPPP